MKKYLLLIGLLALISVVIPTIDAKAQWPTPKLLTTTAFGNALDTVDNTETHVTTPADGRVATWKTGLTAQVNVLKISGTVGGSLALQGSMNGTDWVTIGNAATPSDGSANYSFNTTVRWYYYRISYAGTGTMSASMKCYLFAY